MADTNVQQWAVDAADEIHEKYILEYDPPQYAPSSLVIAAIIDRHAEQEVQKLKNKLQNRLSTIQAMEDDRAMYRKENHRFEAALREIKTITPKTDPAYTVADTALKEMEADDAP